MMSNEGHVRMLAVGDVLVDRPDPTTAFAHAKRLLAESDILFGNCEAVYTSREERAPSCYASAVVEDETLPKGLADAGFSVMSCANNHSVDAGHAGLLDTIGALDALGIAVCGAGRNIAGARRPAIVQRRGTTFAFLAYSSVFPAGYEARPGVPGIAPMRTYAPSEASVGSSDTLVNGGPWDLPDIQDLALLEQDVKSVRERADIVVVSLHWGEPGHRSSVSYAQRHIAHAAIDYGADIILGHHPPLLRGVEMFRGKPIFYGLGQFVFDLRNLNQRVTPGVLELQRAIYGEYAMGPRDGWPLRPFPEEARMTIAACIEVSEGEILNVAIAPCLFQPDGSVVPHDPSSAPGRMVVKHMEAITKEAGLNTIYTPTEEELQPGQHLVTVRQRMTTPE
jgi:poly-gamma-glutamate capsule biosynthesis protein CapA/YwtB (metallophosphatase superfamily)